VRFTTTTALVTLLLEVRENRSLQRFHKQLERLDLLILDELGYVPFSKAGAQLLFDVVARAYERSSLPLEYFCGAPVEITYDNTKVLGGPARELTGHWRNFAPIGEGLVVGEDDGLLVFVTLADDLEPVRGLSGIEGEVADLVDDEQLGPDWVLLKDAVQTLMAAVELIRREGLRHRMDEPKTFFIRSLHQRSQSDKVRKLLS
jgi:hypothetical protein